MSFNYHVHLWLLTYLFEYIINYFYYDHKNTLKLALQFLTIKKESFSWKNLYIQQIQYMHTIHSI